MTLAHCVRHKKVEDLAVHLGKHNSSQANEAMEQTRHVSKINVHPQFDPKTWNMDFALLEMKSSVMINDYVRTVCLPSSLNTNALYRPRTVIVTGWGYSKPASQFRPDILQYIKISTWKQGQCGRFAASLITNDMVCAGGQEKDACQVSIK